jgi:hypothetical protein
MRCMQHQPDQHDLAPCVSMSLSEPSQKRTSNMNIFARDNLWRPVLLACIVFLATGYALYLGALWLPAPRWGRELVAWCMPVVKALDSAERVGIISGRDPFPAQVVILYCALGSILLIAWCLFWFGYSRQAREVSLMPYLDQDKNGASFRIEWLFCGIAGLTYIAVSGLAIYMSYATSFSPMFNSAPQHILTPTLGKQIETGIKYAPDNSNLQFSASLYETRQRNLITNVENKKQDVQPNEVRMRGLELEASARIGRHLDLRASYTRQNINNLRSDEPHMVGKWPVDVPRPRQMGTLWADYRWRSGKLSGLTLGTGIRYVGEAAGNADNSLRIPAYALLDAALRYDLQHWQFSLTGSNVFDRTYGAGCESRSTCRYGDSRSVLATARYRW